ncbi:ABC transporter permease [Acetobacter persici]|uniref:ABC transporter permease n=1 Tax=Acetobacter persici TaxID=1076596 RepID=UPI0036DB7B99
MLTGILTPTFRTLSRHRLYTLINLIGLALGIAVFLIMMLIVRYETTYDSYIPHAASLYQVDELLKPAGHSAYENDAVSFVSFPFLKQDFPEISHAIRLLSIPQAVRAGEILGRETVTLTDQDFLSVFDLPLLSGDKATALDAPGKVIISANLARKYFGTVEAVGRKIRIDNHEDGIISAIMADTPSNSTETFNIITLFPSKFFTTPPYTLPFKNWGSTWGHIYLRIDNADAVPRIRQELMAYPARHPGTYSPRGIQTMFGTGGLILIPLKDIHFHNARIGEGGTSRQLVDILALVGLAALATALVNYINMATARAGLRAKDVAMRKVLGASRLSLVIRFMSEAIFLTCGAALLALALSEFALQWVNAFGGWQISYNWFFILPVAGSIALLSGAAAGLYPSFVLSAFRPVDVLSASRMPGGGRLDRTVRNALVTLQFTFASLLAICTLVMAQQARFVQALDRGMTNHGLIVIDALSDDTLKNRQAAIITRLAEVPGVTVATRSDLYPHHMSDSDDWKRPGQNTAFSLQWGYATPGYFDTLGASLVAGRVFDEEHGQDYAQTNTTSDSAKIVVISRLAAKRFGFSSPEMALGQDIQEAQSTDNIIKYRIIGVIEDIRLGGIQSPIRPLLFFGTKAPIDYVAGIVRYQGASGQIEMSRLRKVWEEVVPDVPFSARDVSDILAEDYRSDANHSALFSIGSLVAVAIACLGLYGLSAFTVTRRMQEISIRKVLGARSQDILRLLIGQFLRPIMFATVIAWPVAWMLMQTWLSKFDQRISLTPAPFMLVTLLTLCVAAAAIFSQAWRAARRPPAAGLRQIL